MVVTENFQHFKKLADNIDVSGLLFQLSNNPQLWDENPERRLGETSPHRDMMDIWVRFRDKKELKSTIDYASAHVPFWYPSRRLLPDAEKISLYIMSLVGAVQLGGVLITRIPSLKSIKPHHDKGRWHSEFFNCKVFIPLKTNDRCFNICNNERIVMRTGEAWIFDNLKIHSVENNGDDDRLTLIISTRIEP